MKGYERSPDGTSALIEALTTALEVNPEQRLGQLLVNLAHGAVETQATVRTIWNIPDELWIDMLRSEALEWHTPKETTP